MAFVTRLLTREKTKCFIAIDIGSNAALRSILFDATAKDRAALDKHYFELPVREREADFIRLIDERIRRLVFHYLRRIGRLPEEVLIGIGSHLALSEIGVANAQRERPAAPLRPEEIAQILENYAAAHRVKSADGASLTLASLVPFRLNLDGYRIERLTRATVGRNVEINVFVTYARSGYWEALTRMRSLWGGMKVRFMANRAAIAAAVVSLLAVPDALVIKIGAKLTEVILIGEGAILSTGQFERGGEEASAAIAQRLGIAPADAERIKRQLGSTLLPPRSAEAVRQALGASAEAWLADLIQLLKREERFLLPEKVYLLGGGARLGAVSEILTTAPWFRELTFSEHVSVEVLHAERFSSLGFRNATPPLSGPEDATLASLVGRLIGQVTTPEFLPPEVVEHLE